MNTPVKFVLALAVSLTLGACASGPSDVDARRAADANAALGIDYLRKGNNELALEKLERALSYQSDHTRAQWGLALVYERLEQPDQAQAHFEQALDQSSNPSVLNSYGAFLCEQGQTDEAVSYFERAVANPRYTNPERALTNAGVCLRRTGRAKQSAGFLKRALDRNAEYGPALAAMARLRYASSKNLSARAFFQRLDAVEPLTDKLLLLAARNELALGDRTQARRYVTRYNEAHPDAPWDLDALRNND